MNGFPHRFGPCNIQSSYFVKVKLYGWVALISSFAAKFDLSYILPTIILFVSQLWSIVSYNDLCAKKLIKANYSWSCQYLQGPAAFDFHILKCTLVANAVVNWIWLNTYFETFDCFFKTKLHIIPGWKAFLKDKSAHLVRWKVSI